MKKKIKILLVEDNSLDLDIYKRYLKKDDNFEYKIIESQTLKSAKELIKKAIPDCIILDYMLPDGDGFELINFIENYFFEKPYPVIILTGLSDEKTASEAIEKGVSDYIVKDHLTYLMFLKSIHIVLKRAEDLRKILFQKKQIEKISNKIKEEAGPEIITGNAKFQELLKMLPSIAESDSTVMIQGESGTGKELIARKLHFLSGRKDRPFVAINCGAIPDSLLESELFGYKEGAFTNAVKDKVGKFNLAEGGTLFLDEIGEISFAMQVKLLRVLEEGVFEPLGGVVPFSCDIRILTATHQDLKQMVEKGLFRKDLYYRLNVLTIRLPTLNERKDDISLLTNFFIEFFNIQKQKNIKGITKEALNHMESYDFPGNIRELRNLIERAFILCREGFLDICHLPDLLTQDSQFINEEEYSDAWTLEELENWFVYRVLKKNNFCKNETAKSLGIHRTTLYRIMKRIEKL